MFRQNNEVLPREREGEHQGPGDGLAVRDTLSYLVVDRGEGARRQMPRRTGQRGFTLVEMLVVMVIISLIAALVGPRLFPKLGKGKQSAAKAQIELLGQALDHFRLDVGRHPSTQEGLNALVVNPGIENWDGPYLKKDMPNDPWGKPYIYQCPGTHGDYDLLTYGRDGSPGGEGEDQDIVSWK